MCPGETAATDAQWGDRAFERQYRDRMGLRWLVCLRARYRRAWHGADQREVIMHEERKWFVGIDWASQEHVVSLCDGDGKKIGERKFAHGGTGLSDMISWLLKASGGDSPARFMSPSRHRMVQLSKPYSSAASASIPSTQSNSIVSVTASRSQAPRMTVSIPMC
jgi:Transposase